MIVDQVAVFLSVFSGRQGSRWGAFVIGIVVNGIWVSGSSVGRSDHLVAAHITEFVIRFHRASALGAIWHVRIMGLILIKSRALLQGNA